MKARHAMLVAIAAAVTMTSAGAAAPQAAKQRVAIEGKGVADGSLFGEFVFIPLQTGTLKRDSGTEQSVNRKSVSRRVTARR